MDIKSQIKSKNWILIVIGFSQGELMRTIRTGVETQHKHPEGTLWTTENRSYLEPNNLIGSVELFYTPGSQGNRASHIKGAFAVDLGYRTMDSVLKGDSSGGSMTFEDNDGLKITFVLLNRAYFGRLIDSTSSLKLDGSKHND